MLRVGIIGAGFMGTTHASAWARTPATLAGIYSLNIERMQQVAKQYNTKSYKNLDALIADVDVVDICTPTHLHHQMVIQSAKAGKHIICEKPLARTLTQAREMIEICQNAGVQLLVAHVVRFFPEYAQAKSIVERGEIGKVGVVRLKRASFQPKAGEESWFHDVEKSGGMLHDLMIHDYDYARWVAGDVKQVFAKHVRTNQPDSVGDYALVILRHENGALSNIEGAWAYPAPMFETALEIAGDKGLIEHPVNSSTPLRIHLMTDNDADNPDIAVPTSPLSEDPYATQIKHFYQLLTGEETKPTVTAQDGLHALEIALAATQSAQTGQPVVIEELR